MSVVLGKENSIEPYSTLSRYKSNNYVNISKLFTPVLFTLNSDSTIGVIFVSDGICTHPTNSRGLVLTSVMLIMAVFTYHLISLSIMY